MEKRLKKYLREGRFDNISEVRSRTMSAIRGKNNLSTEVRLRMELMRKGISGWKLHSKDLPGRPDFYFKKAKIAVFVDGCYWHGCPTCGHIPKTRTSFWEAKIKRNKQRDSNKKRALKKMGISSLRIWEHELKKTADTNSAVAKILKALTGSKAKSYKS
jgi:DNA mismatch endonuclease (patch repair protein)